jgi:superfamily II DNA or RNA helicase
MPHCNVLRTQYPREFDELLRRPFPAQSIAIMAVAKRWQQFRTALIIAECGTGKALMSLGAATCTARASRIPL